MGVWFPLDGVSLWNFPPVFGLSPSCPTPITPPLVLVSSFGPLVLPLLCKSGALAQHDAPCVGCRGLFCWHGLARYQRYCQTFQAISQDGQQGPIVPSVVPSPSLATWAWVLGLDTPSCFPFGFTLSLIIYSQTFGIEVKGATSISSTLGLGGYRPKQRHSAAPIPTFSSLVFSISS